MTTIRPEEGNDLIRPVPDLSPGTVDDKSDRPPRRGRTVGSREE